MNTLSFKWRHCSITTGCACVQKNSSHVKTMSKLCFYLILLLDFALLLLILVHSMFIIMAPNTPVWFCITIKLYQTFPGSLEHFWEWVMILKCSFFFFIVFIFYKGKNNYLNKCESMEGISLIWFFAVQLVHNHFFCPLFLGMIDIYTEYRTITYLSFENSFHIVIIFLCVPSVNISSPA